MVRTSFKKGFIVLGMPLMTSLVLTNLTSETVEAAAEDKLVASFNFEDSETGFNGAGAKAEIKGNIALAEGFNGNAAKISNDFWLNVINEDNTPLLKGLEEITISYASQATTNNHGWSFFAAANTAVPTYQREQYLGIIDKSNSNLTVERWKNEGSRTESLKTGNTSEWKKVDVVITETTTKIYVDGIEKASGSNSVKLSDIVTETGGILQVGKSNWGSGEYYNGLIDDWKIYNKALSANEILENYREHKEILDAYKAEQLEKEIAENKLKLAAYTADFPTEQGDYTKATWRTLTEAKVYADDVINDDHTSVDTVKRAVERFDIAYQYAATVKETLDYTELGIPLGEEWLDTEGNHIQAHGGGFLQQTYEDGKPIYYWVGENKIHNGASFFGVSLYSSRDLVTWTNEGNVLDRYSETIDGAENGLKGNKIERPKLLYNEKTKKYVLWGHWEAAGNYNASQISVATADNPEGPYLFLGHWRPGGTEKNWRSDGGTYYDSEYLKPENERENITVDENDPEKWGYLSRDFTVFQDGDEAYLVHAQGHDMRIQRLNEDFTDVDLSTQEWTTEENRDSSFTSYKFYDGAGREAPAVVKVQGSGYYMVTSGQSGWMPNQTIYGYTADIKDATGWTIAKNPNTGQLAEQYATGNNSSFYSQPTNIMTVTDEHGNESYVYMGDRWTSKALGGSRYVWLPLNIDTQNNTVELNYVPDWKLDVATGSVHLPNNTALVSQGKKAFGGEGNPDRPLSNLNDGYFFGLNTWGDNTHYYSPDSTPSETTIDLGKAFDLSRLDVSWRLNNGSEAINKFKVYGSVDNVNWVELADETNNQWVGFTTTKLSGEYRYVKVHVTGIINFHNGNGADWARGIVEMQVFADQNKESLSALVTTERQANRDSDKYTDTSWEVYSDALLKAEKILVDTDVNQTEINQAETSLRAGLEALEEKPEEEIKATEIKVNVPSLSTLKVKKTLKVTTAIQPENVTDKSVDWSIANTDILEMTEDGVFVGKKTGTTKVTASTKNGISTTFIIRVTP